MAALLKFAPIHGALTTAETIARLEAGVRVALHRQPARHPTLVCRWIQDASGRLSCHWECSWEHPREPSVLADIPIPPD
jgi:hypothetical protein